VALVEFAATSPVAWSRASTGSALPPEPRCSSWREADTPGRRWAGDDRFPLCGFSVPSLLAFYLQNLPSSTGFQADTNQVSPLQAPKSPWSVKLPVAPAKRPVPLTIFPDAL
jgi:hypothetical protein